MITVGDVTAPPAHCRQNVLKVCVDGFPAPSEDALVNAAKDRQVWMLSSALYYVTASSNLERAHHIEPDRLFVEGNHEDSVAVGVYVDVQVTRLV